MNLVLIKTKINNKNNLYASTLVINKEFDYTDSCIKYAVKLSLYKIQNLESNKLNYNNGKQKANTHVFVLLI